MTTFIRGEHKGDYTQLSNKTLRDTSLSWKARGLLAYMLTHAPGYHIQADNLHTFSSDGPFTTASAIKELKNKGYICFHKQQNPETKKWAGGDWTISEEAGLPISRPSEKTEAGFIGGRLSRRSINRMFSKKDQEEKKNNKKEEQTERTPSLEIVRFVKKFYAIQRERFPTIVKNTPASQITQACSTIDKLVRIDKYTLPQVIKTITWSLDDDFWATNVHSLVGLRNLSDNGNTKFVNILSQMTKSTKGATNLPGQQGPDDDLDIGTTGRNYSGAELTKDDDE